MNEPNGCLLAGYNNRFRWYVVGIGGIGWHWCHWLSIGSVGSFPLEFHSHRFRIVFNIFDKIVRSQFGDSPHSDLCSVQHFAIWLLSSTMVSIVCSILSLFEYRHTTSIVYVSLTLSLCAVCLCVCLRKKLIPLIVVIYFTQVRLDSQFDGSPIYSLTYTHTHIPFRTHTNTHTKSWLEL